jgi:hypothetical protein
MGAELVAASIGQSIFLCNSNALVVQVGKNTGVDPSNGTAIALGIYRQAMLQQFRYSNTEDVGGHLKQLSRM